MGGIEYLDDDMDYLENKVNRIGMMKD